MGTIGEKIRKLRKSQGLTLNDLGEKMGITGSLVGQYERGIVNPKPETITRFANALGVSATELRFEAEQEQIHLAAAEAIAEIEDEDSLINGTRDDYLLNWEGAIADAANRHDVDPFLLSCYVPRHGEITDPDIQKVSDIMQTMNDTGRRVAVERVQELAQIPAYQQPDPNKK